MQFLSRQFIRGLLYPFGLLGNVTMRILAALGRAGFFGGRMLGASLTPPWKGGRILHRMWFVGFQSLLVILLTGTFTGMVLSLQGYYALSRFGSEAFLGPMVALSLLRELGPVLTALMVTGRAGSALAAEIGIMRNGEQIDALELMGVNPFRYLVAPTLLAAVLVLPLLTAIFDVMGIAGGYLVSVELLGVSPGTYFGEMPGYINFSDISGGMYKAVTFGAIISWVCSFKGYYTPPGAAGVSRATTGAVVVTSVLILVWDYFMTSMLF
ncbi:MAG: MlaE family lipid ABC transporter permease subunit [Lentisphaeria bacterium]